MTERALKLYLEELKIEIITAITEQVSKPNKQLLTVREAAEYLGVSYNTFQKFRYEGLKIFEVDGIKRIYKHELDKFIEDNCY
ncbi:helix-turn-helix domain-containing protein [Lysinibacillus sphaericus]|uniref:helix-turn-helix domain-containing protein n=1 Tax=Lysinibacillus sphaericus TaxID=1421 RepID=UPI003D0406A1